MSTSLAANGRVLVGLSVGLLVACGGGGYGGDGSSNPPATLTISVEPTTITVGQSATITWTTNGAACTATGAWSGTRGASGSESVSPAAAGTYTYTLVCSGGGYGESQVTSATLTVNPASAFTRTLLVSSFAGSAAPTTDSTLVNPRGIVLAPGAPVRVVSGRASAAYDGQGKAQSPSRALPLNITASAMGVTLDPTGIVANTTSDFVIAGNGMSGPAEFMYADRSGAIRGWSGALDRDSAMTLHTATDDAVYMGLAVARHGSDHFLYATDFRNNKIDVLDAQFRRQTPSAGRFGFRDPTLADGYAPFGIQAIDNGADGSTQIYVTYARRISPDDRDAASGAGLGLVNVFDTGGRLLRHLVAESGALNAPWGIALAPADFGTLSNALLIGNSGDGRINAYDPASGVFIGTLSDADARPIATPGLWGIAFGNDSHQQSHNTLFFAAGTDAADGTYGRIDLGVMPPML